MIVPAQSEPRAPAEQALAALVGMTRPTLSVVIPLKDEQDGVATLFARLAEVLDRLLPGDHEVVCVNDGSSDATLAALLAEQRKRPNLVIVDLSRNFGKEAALTAGLANASGRTVVPLDADLQDPPELIGEMLARWREGYEVVCARRVQRTGDGPFKRLTARLFYALIRRISDVEIPSNVGDFRLMDQAVVQAVLSLPERTRFNKGLFAWLGFRQCIITYDRPERAVGTSKWRYWRLWNFALDGITSFSSLPLRIWSYLGMAMAMLAMVYAAVIVVKTMVSGRDVPGYASLMCVVLVCSGLILMGIGVIGEYLSRIFIEVKGRPLYIVRRTYRGEARSAVDA